MHQSILAFQLVRWVTGLIHEVRSSPLAVLRTVAGIEYLHMRQDLPIGLSYPCMNGTAANSVCHTIVQAEAGAPDVLARLSNACAVASGGGNASTLATVSCLALEILFALER